MKMENGGFYEEKVPEHQYPAPTSSAARGDTQQYIHPVPVIGPTTQSLYGPNGSVQVHPPPPDYMTTPSNVSYPHQNCSGQPCHCFYGSTVDDREYLNEQMAPTDWRRRIPIMPMWLAVTCLVINCILPGFGTLISSCSICCCTEAPLAGHGKCRSQCSTFWVGWAQLISIVFFLIGYVWAIAWSVASIKLSRDFYGKDHSRIRDNRQNFSPHNAS